MSTEEDIELGNIARRLSKMRRSADTADAQKSNLENRNEFMRGVMRGTDSLQATAHGGLGMLASAMGDPLEANRSFGAYKEEMRQSSENPATVTDFFSTDEKTGAMASPGNMGTWAAGSLGNALPSLAESIGTGIAGAAAGSMVVPGPDPTDAVGFVSGFLGKGGAKRAIANAAKEYVKDGYEKQVAKEMAISSVQSSLARRAGSAIGTSQSTALHEGGGMWAEGMEKGIDNPVSALILGQLSGASESAFGAVPSGLRMFAKKANVAEIAKQSGTRAAAGYLWDAVKNTGEEGLQEIFQEFLGSVNETINDPEKRLFTRENFMKWAEAGAAGAVVGGAVGSLGSAKSAYEDFSRPEPSPEDKAREDEIRRKIAAFDKPPGRHDWAEIIYGDRDRLERIPSRAERQQKWEQARADVASQQSQPEAVPQQDVIPPASGAEDAIRPESQPQGGEIQAEAQGPAVQPVAEAEVQDEAKAKARLAEEIARRKGLKNQPVEQPAPSATDSGTMPPQSATGDEATVPGASTPTTETATSDRTPDVTSPTEPTFDDPKDKQEFDNIRQKLANLKSPPRPDQWAEIVLGDKTKTSGAPSADELKKQWDDARTAFPIRTYDDVARKDISKEILEARRDFLSKAKDGTQFTRKGYPSSLFEVKDGKLKDLLGNDRPMGSVVDMANSVNPNEITWKEAKPAESSSVPMPKNYEEIEALPKYSIYGRDDLKGKTTYQVRGDGKRGGGDTIHDTLKDAQEYADLEKRRDKERKITDDRRVEQEKADQKKKEEYEASFGGFLSSDPKTKGRQLKVLSSNRRVDGKLLTVKEIIEKDVNEGAIVDDNNRLMTPDQTFRDSTQLTKIGIDYARHLIRSKSGDTVSSDNTQSQEKQDAPQTKKGGDPNEVQAKGKQRQTQADAETQGQVSSKNEDQATGETPSPDSSAGMTEGFRSLPANGRAAFETEWKKGTDSIKNILYLENKNYRAEFEARTGIKLPKTVKGTFAAVEDWNSEGRKTVDDIFKELKDYPEKVAGMSNEEIKTELENLKAERDADTKSVESESPSVGQKIKDLWNKFDAKANEFFELADDYSESRDPEKIDKVQDQVEALDAKLQSISAGRFDGRSEELRDMTVEQIDEEVAKAVAEKASKKERLEKDREKAKAENDARDAEREAKRKEQEESDRAESDKAAKDLQDRIDNLSKLRDEPSNIDWDRVEQIRAMGKLERSRLVTKAAEERYLNDNYDFPEEGKGSQRIVGVRPKNSEVPDVFVSGNSKAEVKQRLLMSADEAVVASYSKATIASPEVNQSEFDDAALKALDAILQAEKPKSTSTAATPTKTKLGQYVLPGMSGMAAEIDKQDFVRRYRDNALNALWGWSSDPNDDNSIQETIDALAPLYGDLFREIYAGKFKTIESVKDSEAFGKIDEVYDMLSVGPSLIEESLDAQIREAFKNAPKKSVGKKPRKSDETLAEAKTDRESAKAAAAALMAKHRNKLTSGVDPELMAETVQVALMYVKAGVKTFKGYVEAILEDFGDSFAREFAPYMEAGWKALNTRDVVKDPAGKVVDLLKSKEDADRVENEFKYGESVERSDDPNFVGRFEGIGQDGNVIVRREGKRTNWPASKTVRSQARLDDQGNPIEESELSAQTRIANRVVSALERGEALTGPSFFAIADEEFGGKRSNNDYGDSQATDALELGVNMYLRGKTNANATQDEAKNILGQIKSVMELIPRHRGRTGNKDTMQQFSTPPAYAYAVNWIANVGKSDVVLEPSAGMGGIAIHAINSGAKVYANELDKSRADGLRDLPLEGVFTEDAEQIGAILAGRIPGLNLILMNPPFSRAGMRMGDKMVQGTDRKHIDEALGLLPDGGRLVAIVGAGLHGQGQKMTKWLDDLPYRVTANIEVAREVYRGYGTEFPTRVLVIDKVPRAGAKTIVGVASDLSNLIDIAKEVRDARTSTSLESASDQQDGVSGTKEDGSADGSASDARGSVDTGVLEPSDSGEGATEGGTLANDRGDGDAAGNADAGSASGNTGSKRGGGKRGGSSRKSSRSSTSGRSSNASSGKPDDIRRGGVTKVRAISRSRSLENKSELTESTFEEYVPTVAVEGARPHPAPIVESAAMAAVDAPSTDYEVDLMPGVFEGYVNEDGIYVGISDIQLEAIALAGAAHNQMLPSGERRGFLIGDGTGVGKAREALGIIMDDLIKRGTGKRRKAVFITKNDGLVKDAVNEWVGVGGDKSELHPLSDVGSGEKIGVESGVLTVSYDTLRGEASLQAKALGNQLTRVEQIIDWVGSDFDGVVVFDEAHLMANSLDSGQGSATQKASQRALSGVELQQKLPNARFVYLSATAATEVRNLAYAERLGLWGPGTEFDTKSRFITEIEAGGVAAMEKVAADMKAMGMYTARNLSYNDGTENGKVEFDRIQHLLTNDQRRVYDKLSEAWLRVLQNIEEALGITGNERGKSRIMSAFWSGNQRFWNEVVTSMMAPTLIKNIEADLKAGRSVVVQLSTTKEAATNRAIAGMRQGQTYDDIDSSPRRTLMEFVERSFPTQRYEEYIDDAGNTRTRPVVDSEGKPVMDPQALAMKERLLDEVGSLDVAARGPIDMILDHFGVDMVAEVSGRSQRLVKGEDGRLELEKRSKASARSDREAFMDGNKRVLLFSEAGGTGASYHASLSAKNQQRRSHYLWQPGWSATTAVQGLGRAHRSNQASAPMLHLLEPNLEGYKRFISTVARRLGQLGALTKGQRTAADAGLFGANDNLESTESNRALFQFIVDAMAGNIDGIDQDFLVQRLGFDHLASAAPDPRSIGIVQFLNRLLNLPLGDQSRVFKAFSDRLDGIVAEAIQNGTLDQGMETVKAVKIVKSREVVVNVHASGAETKLVELTVTRNQRVVSFDEMLEEKAMQVRSASYEDRGFVQSKTTGKVFVVLDQNRVSQDSDGRTMHDAMLMGVNGYSYGHTIEKLDNKQYWESLSAERARAEWDRQFADSPRTVDIKWRLLTGALLPVWRKISSNERRVWRAKTVDGETILGRFLSEETLARTLERLGVTDEGISSRSYTPRDAIQAIYEGNTVELSNGWKIKKKSIDGEENIEILGPDYTSTEGIVAAGGFTRRIDYTTRFFIPFDDSQGNVLAEVARISPIKTIIYKSESQNNLARNVRNLPDTLMQTESDDVNESALTSALDIALAAEDAGIQTFDKLVAFSVKTIGENKTREIGAYLRLAAEQLGMQGIRKAGDVLGDPNVTKEQAVELARAAFPMLSDEQVEAGIALIDRLGLLAKIGFAPAGTPVPSLPRSTDSVVRDGESINSDRVKGWTHFISATRAIVGATNKADVSTFIHEIAHPMRRFMFNRNVPSNQRYGITDSEIVALEEALGVENGDWKTVHEEKFAKMWEQYWFEGRKSVDKKLDSLFEKISAWMQNVYKTIRGITGKQLPQEVNDLFDKLVRRGAEPADDRSVTEKGWSSIKNAVAEEIRSLRGMPALADVSSQTQQQWLDEASDMMESDPFLGDRLVKEINRSPRNLDNVEVAVMQIYYRHVLNTFNEASDKLEAADKKGDSAAKAAALAEADMISNSLGEIEEAAKKAGREWGRAGVARQIVLAKDFSLIGLRRKARVANAGNPLNAVQSKQIDEMAREIANLQDKLAKAEQAKLDAERKANVQAEIDDHKKNAPPPGFKAKARQKAVAKLNAFKNKFASIFGKESDSGPLYATEDEQMAEDAREIVRSYVDELNIYSFGEFMANVRKDLGGEIPPQVEAAFSMAWEDAVLEGDIPVPSVDKNDVGALSRLAREIARGLVEAGVEDRDEVVNGVYITLKEIIPEITIRETMDAISGYGQFYPPSMEPTDVIMRDIKGQLLQLAKLDDMRNKIAPRATGFGRGEMSPEQRDLVRQVNDMKKTSQYKALNSEAHLKTVFQATRRALENRIYDLNKAIKEKQRISGRVATEFTGKEAEELEKLRKNRDDLMAQYKETFPKPEATMEQRVAAANRALDRVIADLERQVQSGNVTTDKKSVRVSTPELEAKRTRIGALRAQKESILDLQNPNRKDEQSEKAYKANLLNRLADYEERIANKDFQPKPKKEVRTLTREELDLKKQLKDVKDKFFRLARDYRLSHMSPMEKAWDYTKETANLSRALMTSLDLSAVFRQGGTASFSHPKLAKEAAAEMWAAMKSSKAEFDIAERIRDDDMYQFAMTAGLDITEEDGAITKQEEAFAGRWAREGLGKEGTKLNDVSKKLLTPVSASARAYITFLNGMRFRLFKHMVANLGKGGQVTADEAKVIAKFINVSTGRSSLGPAMKWAESLNAVFFAPRYVLSRFQYLGMPLWMMADKNISGRVKKAIAMEYIRHATGVASFLTMAVALGALIGGDDEEKPTVELDPRSSDFMKLKIGETRIDPMSGFSQAIVLMSRVASGQRKSTNGEIVDLRGPDVKYGQGGTSAVLGNFLRSKLAPIPGTAIDIVSGENVVGQPETPIGAVTSLFVPLAAQELLDTMRSQGIPKGTAVTMLALLGMGASTYGPKTDFAKADEAKRIDLMGKDDIIQSLRSSGVPLSEARRLLIKNWEENRGPAREMKKGVLVYKEGLAKRLSELRKAYAE